ncbi:MAG: hypothetical protein A2Y20_01575 [Firmicutes bacterium GWF2_51_9]|nr:EFR1 family ferrodoxin [Erysipelotrichaceae bacterium]OGS53522.1 MAG: hypothetical protein A2Y20_01575 [Firmicutes bacterium GWF2_51_9]OGS58590.1 MAG: hypothetical protein A2Y19_07845 [Firmicutes bacterium GWE2_51_13]HAO61311.1 hypothetical protein [Erysipelotrichaceae bacterium]HBZ41867.1 hypothetical protein [Erysipelotrichaceae bacterium]
MIFYFTGSGNSLSVASQLIRDEPLVSIVDAMRDRKYTFDPGESVGIVFPIYFYTLPTVVETFLEKLRFSYPPDYVYAVATCGGTTGAAMEKARRILSRKGVRLSASFSVLMPDNYILLYNPPTEEQVKLRLIHSKTTIGDIRRLVRSQERGDFNLLKGPLPHVVSLTASTLYRFSRGTVKFNVDDTCISCGLCEEVCPTRTIAMGEKKPKWVNPTCSHCLACIHRCPVEAIQYGQGTRNRRRYQNPEAKF